MPAHPSRQSAAQVHQLHHRDSPEANGGDAASRRVVSVSPGDAIQSTAEAGTHLGEVMISPRVIDQISFDKLAEVLRSLIDQANASAGELREGLEKTAQIRKQSPKASQQLQERLRVSARMLKAFQSQIEQVRATVADLQESKEKTERASAELEAVLSGLQRRSHEATEQFEQHAAEVSRCALQHFEQQVTAPQQALADFDQRINDAQDRVDALVGLVETVEVNVAVLAHKTALAAKQSQDDSTHAAQIFRQCEGSKKALADELLELSTQVDAVSKRGDAVAQKAQASGQQIESHSQRMDDCLSRLAQAREQDEHVHETCRRLDELLGRLQSWEPLARALDASVDDHLHPLVRITDQLRKGPGQEVLRLAQGMHAIADQVEALFAPSTPAKLTRPVTRGETVDTQPKPEISTIIARSPTRLTGQSNDETRCE